LVHDLCGQRVMACEALVLACKGVAREPCLHAPALPAVAGFARQLVLGREGQGVVSPVASAVVGPVVWAAVNSDSRTRSTGDDDTEHDPVPHAGTVGCLRRSEAVRIVLDSQGTFQNPKEILLYGLAVDPGGTAALADSTLGFKRTGNTDANTARSARGVLEALHDSSNERQTAVIVPAGGRLSDAQELGSVGFECDAFDLGTTPVDADEHRTPFVDIFRAYDNSVPASLEPTAPMLHLRLLGRVARMYVERGLTQQQIAEQLGLSQARVSRLLKEAHGRQIVRSVVVMPEGVNTALEDVLEETFGLADVVVVDTAGAGDPARALGVAAGAYLDVSLVGADVIGVSSWSGSLVAAVESMRPHVQQRARTVVQMFGGVGDPAVQVQATRLTGRLSEVLRAKPLYMPSPAIVGNSSTRKAVLADHSVSSVVQAWDAMSVSLVGIGAIEPSPLLQRSGNALSAEESEELASRGAVGDICLRYFDAEGVPVPGSVDDRLMGMTAKQMKAVPRRIAVAGGLAKTGAIRAALLGGWVSVLITDQEVAEALVAS